VKFYAPWCRTCAGIKPTFDRVASKSSETYGDRVQFFEVNFKESRELCASQRIVLLPTIHFYLKGWAPRGQQSHSAKDSAPRALLLPRTRMAFVRLPRRAFAPRSTWPCARVAAPHSFGRVNRFVLTPSNAGPLLRRQLERFLGAEAQMEMLLDLQRGGRDALVRYADLVKALKVRGHPPRARCT
jgi:thiol-disulfide isomerase/thioredoxin